MLFWPAESAHLNAIELMLDEFDRKLKANNPSSAPYSDNSAGKTWPELFSVYL